MTAGSQEGGRRDGGAPHEVHMCQRPGWPGNAHRMATSLAHSPGTRRRTPVHPANMVAALARAPASASDAITVTRSDRR